MNAIKFIQQNGVDKAREIIAKEQFVADLCLVTPSGNLIYYKEVKGSFPEVTDFGKVGLIADDYLMLELSDLKRLVESIYLVKEHYTLDRAIEYANSPYTAPEIKVCLLDAIADYKSIYSNDCEILDHPEDYTSPNCKKFDERVK